MGSCLPRWAKTKSKLSSNYLIKNGPPSSHSYRSLQIFSVKDQIANILGFAGYMFTVTTN